MRKRKYQYGNFTGLMDQIQPYGQVKSTIDSDYNLQNKGQLGDINYQHVMLSNTIKGIAAFFRDQHKQKSDNSYYNDQFNPLGYLPQTGNTSEQAQFGEDYYKSGGLTAAKAKEILKDGTAHGHKLTKKQKKYFGLVAGGGKPKVYKKKQEGGVINTTGYLDGAETAQNPYNIIPGGDITMKGVSQPIIATPIKQSKFGASKLMLPGTDYKFDADFVHERKMQEGGPVDDELQKEIESSLYQEESPNQDVAEETPEEEVNMDPNQMDASTLAYLLSGSKTNTDRENRGQIADETVDYGTENVSNELEAFKNGIANVESGGDYYAQGKGSSAYGKYQFLKDTREAIRKQFFPDIPAKDFEETYKRDPKFQEKVMDVYGSHLLSTSNSPEQAALKHFLGEAGAQRATSRSYNPGGNNVNVGTYIDKFHQGYKDSYQLGGEYEVSDEELEQLKAQGYKVEVL